jgi:hypothetical protein
MDKPRRRRVSGRSERRPWDGGREGEGRTTREESKEEEGNKDPMKGGSTRRGQGAGGRRTVILGLSISSPVRMAGKVLGGRSSQKTCWEQNQFAGKLTFVPWENYSPLA